MKPFLLTCSLLVCASVLFSAYRDGESAQSLPGTPPPMEVGVVTIEPQQTDIVTELPGRTVPFRVAEVRPQVTGIILKRLFTEGGKVKEGQPLYRIDPATYQAAVENAEATVKRAEAAELAAKYLEQRRKGLLEKRAISQQEYDDSYASYQSAQADVASAKAALKTAEINLLYTNVLAPISGRIGRSVVTEGALVTANQAAALATIQQFDPIYVDISQSATQVLRLAKELSVEELINAGEHSAPVRLKLEDGTEYAHAGQLQFSEVTVDQETGSVTLRALFPNPKRQLLPGMFVRAFVQVGTAVKAILVPQKAVTRNPRGEPVAMVVDANNRIESRILKTDRVIGNRWLVTKGIQAGDQVVVEGLQKIAPGASVKPVEVAALTE